MTTPSQNRNSVLAVLLTASVVTGCSDLPTEVAAKDESVTVSAPAPSAYSSEELVAVRAGLDDALERVVAGITDETAAHEVRAAITSLTDQLASNNSVLIRRRIGEAIAVLDRLNGSESANPHAADVESVRLLLVSATELLPGETLK